jgi:hypothetical protein
MDQHDAHHHLTVAKARAFCPNTGGMRASLSLASTIRGGFRPVKRRNQTKYISSQHNQTQHNQTKHMQETDP